MLAMASNQHGEEIVVGYSCWVRKETSRNKVPLEMYRRHVNARGLDALAPITARQEAISRRRKPQPSDPLDEIAGFALSGLAIRDKFQGCGIGSALVRWGRDRAASEKVPVFATGEARGVGFYKEAMGFQKIAESECWLDKNDHDVSEDEVRNGSTAWTTEEGGLTGAHVLWLPGGVSTS
ncbi:hypothetical protein BBAD15_g9068 [Beauveria bassiana D1-5]|uniref:N-acetyltransferase domain-containing protein n=1 Tax=Beauveria bassiana D1-5 TaxID=1245745 RepID=A0A0A2VHX1_BEABA|nr:hypothetical protein BBAD15_g9068 [Beauveria bassiana D1-5]